MSGRQIPPSQDWQEERAALLARIAELEPWVAVAKAATETVRLLKAELDHLEEERRQQAEVMEAMKAELDALKRHVFGQRSESMPSVDRELRRKGKTKKDPAKEQQRRKDNKDKKAALETEDIDQTVDRDAEPDCPKCGKAADSFVPVGEGRETVVFEYVPAKFIRRKHHRQVLACTCKEHIIVAKGPVKLGEGGGNYGPGFVAHLMVSRALDAIPFYRMEKQFKRLGIPMARSTMVNLFHRYATDLKPLVDLLTAQVAAAEAVLADETPHKMQVKGDTGKHGKGYMWVFIAGDKVVYRFAPSRSGETPREILGGTTGTLVVDAYTGYNSVSGPEGRARAGCMAHARRRFYDAFKAGHEEAQAALDYILQLYHPEHDARAQGLARKPEHLAMRKARSGPVMERFHEWLTANQGLYTPKGPMGGAIRYALNNWDALREFLKSEQIPMDNNESEAALRIVALSRKNSLFVGHDEAGENLARVLTIGTTCEMAGVNPLEYIADVLLRIQTWPQERLAELLPAAWQQLKETGELPPINVG